MSEEKRTGGFGRWLKRIGIVLLILIGIVVILLATGIPQRKLMKRALSNALGPDVKVSGVSTLGKIKIAEISTPELDVKGVSVDYALRAPDKRNLPKVHVDSVTFHHERARAGETPETSKSVEHHKRGERHKERNVVEEPSYWGGQWHLFVSKLQPLMKKMTPDPERFVPKNVEVDAVDFSRIAPSASFGIAGPSLTAEIKNANNFAAVAKADNATVFWAAGSPDVAHKFPGKLNVGIEKGGGNTIIDPLNISFPGMAEIAGVVRVVKKEGKFDCNVNLEKALLQDVDLSQADARDLRVPFAFKRVDFSGTHVQGKAGLDGLNVIAPEIGIKVAAEGLRVGPKDHELYDGDLHLDVNGKPGDVNLAMEMTLNRGQKIHATLSGPTTDLLNKVQVDGWSKDDLLAALPKDVRGPLATVPIQGIISAELDVAIKLLSVEFTLSVKPAFATGEALLELTASGQGSVLGPFGATMLTNAGLTVGEGAIKAERQTPVPPFMNIWLANVENVALVQAVHALTGQNLPAALDTRLKGTVQLETDTAIENIKGEVNLSGSAFPLAPGDEISVKGAFSGENKDTCKIAFPSIDAVFGKLGVLALHDVTIAAASTSLRGDIKALDLAALTNGLTIGSFKASGVVNGTLNVAGVADCSLALTSTEGFAIDQGTLRRLLESPLVQLADHAQVEKASAEIKDKEELIPLDSGTLNLTFKDGRLSGALRLKGRQWDLNFPLAADRALMFEGMKLLWASVQV